MNEELLSFAAQSARFLQDVSVDCCQQFFWMTIAAGIFGFLMACGIGANDVANGESQCKTTQDVIVFIVHNKCIILRIKLTNIMCSPNFAC